jgi:hypothetical protein
MRQHIMSIQDQSQPSIENDEFWRKHHEAQQSSGLSRAMYCRQYELNYNNFAYWIKKQKNHVGGSLIAVKLKSDVFSTSQNILCTLDLKNGHSLKIYDTQALTLILERYS